MTISMARFRSALATFALLSLGLLTEPAGASDNSPLLLANPHAYSGFGVNLWPGDLSQDQNYQLLQQIGARAIRVSITPDIAKAKLGLATTEQDLETLLETDGGDAWRNAIMSLGKRTHELNLEVHVVFFSVPSVWRVDRPRKDDPSKIDRLADPSKSQGVANWIAANLHVVDKLGLKTSFVELANEPDGTWNTRFTPQGYADLLVKTGAALKQVGLSDVKIEGPGSSKLSADSDYLAALKSDGEMPLLAAVSGHDYMIEGPPPLGGEPLADSMMKLGVRLPVHITEFSDADPRWGTGEFKTVPKQRGPDNGADSLSFAMDVAAEGLRLISDGAAETFLWELRDQSWEGQSFGLMNLDGQLRPLAGAILNSIGQLPRDSLVRGCKFKNVAFVADQHDSHVILSGVNPDSQDISVLLKIQGLAVAQTQMTIVSFPKGRVVSVRVDPATSEIALKVPALTAFSVRWPS